MQGRVSFLFGFLKVFFGMTKEKVCVLIFILTEGARFFCQLEREKF